LEEIEKKELEKAREKQE
jgi:hypothetical protein